MEDVIIVMTLDKLTASVVASHLAWTHLANVTLLYVTLSFTK